MPPTLTAPRPTVEEPSYPYMALAAFHEIVRSGAAPGDVLLRKAGSVGTPVLRAPGDGGERLVDVAITSERIDRENDTIALAGWDLTAYRRNPVVLWAHDYYSLPIARANALRVESDLMWSTDEFPPEGVHPFADTVYALIAGGFINATSVGFRPLTWAFDEERFGVDFLEHEMLEHSWVPIPANPDALVAARSAGIDIVPLREWAEATLANVNGEQGLWLPRRAVEDAIRVIEYGRRTFGPTTPPAPDVTANPTKVTLVTPDAFTRTATEEDKMPDTNDAPIADPPAAPPVSADNSADTPPPADDAGIDILDMTPEQARVFVDAALAKADAAREARLRGRLD